MESWVQNNKENNYYNILRDLSQKNLLQTFETILIMGNNPFLCGAHVFF